MCSLSREAFARLRKDCGLFYMWRAPAGYTRVEYGRQQLTLKSRLRPPCFGSYAAGAGGCHEALMAKKAKTIWQRIVEQLAETQVEMARLKAAAVKAAAAAALKRKRYK